MTQTLVSCSTLMSRANELDEEIISLRRQLHQMPELSFQEFNTSKVVADWLLQTGYRVHSGVAKTGVVASYGAGAAVALRCELDALPLHEMNYIGYASRIPGVMHACGHDANIASMLGAAKLLVAEPAAGEVRFIFQPGDEVADADGRKGTDHILEVPELLSGVGAVLGMHVDATIKRGCVAIVMPAPVDKHVRFTMSVMSAGKRKSVASVLGTAANLVCEIEKLSFSLNAAQSQLVIDSFQSAGEEQGKFPENVTIGGALNCVNEGDFSNVKERLGELIDMAGLSGNEITTVYERAATDCNNSEQIRGAMFDAACEIAGTSNVSVVKRVSWSAGFQKYTATIPGAFFLLGVELSSSRRTHHSPTFELDETALSLGSALMSESTRRISKQINS